MHRIKANTQLSIAIYNLNLQKKRCLQVKIQLRKDLLLKLY